MGARRRVLCRALLVAAAISIGGPGALLWMWLTAFVGMATKYAEVVLAVYREVDEPATVRQSRNKAPISARWKSAIDAHFPHLYKLGQATD